MLDHLNLAVTHGVLYVTISEATTFDLSKEVTFILFEKRFNYMYVYIYMYTTYKRYVYLFI